MMSNPRPGRKVRVWYAKRAVPFMPLHNKTGTVVVVSRGKPRNHGIEIDGALYVVPCGNLQPLK